MLERYHVTFRRAGAGLDGAAKERLAEIIERLAALGTAFSQNVLADEQDFALPLQGEAELAGLPDFMREAMRSEAQERGLDGHVVTLSRSSVEPFLQFAQRRDLREKVFRAFVSRGDNGGATDNKAIIAEMVQLRAERAHLLGYADFAHYRLDDAMAKTPEAVRDLLDTVWARGAAESARRPRRPAGAGRSEEGGNFELAPWDWRYYADQLRQPALRLRRGRHQAVSQPRPHDRGCVLHGGAAVRLALHRARRRAGLASRRAGLGGARRDGAEIGLFFGDYFARASKRSGAWMTSLRDQEKLAGDIRPLIVNVCNFAKAPDGEPTLLGFEEARTLFHEFGHALHGLLSAVTYPQISGTNVATDFVELPSQLYEHWLEQPEVLRRFARHYQTGAPMPEDLLQRLIAARNFNQGFGTVEYLASAFVDLDFHSLASPGTIDASAFENEVLSRIGMPEEIVMRHRPPHFGHVFSGGGYAAAYYSYMWSEVLDADAFEAFEETGDIFDPATAKRLRETIYAAGGSPRSGRGLQGLPRPAAERGCAAAQARTWPSPSAAGLSMVDLHSAGHRRGVVCAPHYGAVEAGRAILAEGGNALEAMVAMAASIAAVYPHMNHIGGDGFWLIREPIGPRARHHGGRARRRIAARPELYRELRDDPAARAARRAHRAGRRRRLDAGARGGESERRNDCRSMCFWRRLSARPATAIRYRAARRG